jgi:hypothetical protein
MSLGVCANAGQLGPPNVRVNVLRLNTPKLTLGAHKLPRGAVGQDGGRVNIPVGQDWGRANLPVGQNGGTDRISVGPGTALGPDGRIINPPVGHQRAKKEGR